MDRRRLDVESWRDAMLAVAGRLEDHVGGASIDPTDPEETRRTVYAAVSRLDLNPMLALFDFPDPNAHSERRARTTTPLQKLFVLNSPFMLRQAEALADRTWPPRPAPTTPTASGSPTACSTAGRRPRRRSRWGSATWGPAPRTGPRAG